MLASQFLFLVMNLLAEEYFTEKLCCGSSSVGSCPNPAENILHGQDKYPKSLFYIT